MHPVKLFFVDQKQVAQVASLQALITEHKLPMTLTSELIEGEFTKKVRQQLLENTTDISLLLDDKNKLSLLSNGLSVEPAWDKLQRRIVSAGRKSELILQAAKITAESKVLDATAGFGHDSLILASTGAQVTMLEQHPVMALLLFAEQQRMSTLPNWQKLMARLTIKNADALSHFTNLSHRATETIIDVIYLDPMFPSDSYQDNKTGKGAKVGKQMQALHHVAHPPTLAQEIALLKSAREVVANNKQNHGRVIVKRPQQAPFLANEKPNESWQNSAVRFDGYFNSR